MTEALEARLNDLHAVLNRLLMDSGRRLAPCDRASIEHAEEILNEVIFWPDKIEGRALEASRILQLTPDEPKTQIGAGANSANPII